jgi:hypothetical protein
MGPTPGRCGRSPSQSHRSTFEVRTYRRCNRVLAFHSFDELGPEPTLVRTLELDYADLDYATGPSVDAELAHDGSTRLGSFPAEVVNAREKGWAAILFDGSRIEGRVYMRDGFRANRGVHAQSSRIAGGMYCRRGIFEGELDLAGARIDGDLVLAYATLNGDLIEGRHDNGKRTQLDTFSVNFNRLRVAGTLAWRGIDRTSEGEFVVHLAQAHVGYLNDHVDSWKGAQKILDGFTFDGIRTSGKVNPGIVAWRHWGEFGWLLGKLRRWLEGKTGNSALRRWVLKEDTSWVGKRRRWLAAQRGGWSAHPYDQVRAALRSAGQETAARSIAVERERRRRKQLRPGFDRLLNWVFGALLGHGYRPVFAVAGRR